nr:hypothetical protein [Parvularcula maris]
MGIVCGLRSEAAALGKVGQGAAISGADTARAYEGTRRLIAEGAEAVVSVGLAGALTRGLQAGALFLPARVVTETGEAFEAASLPGQEGTLLGSDELVVSAAHKRRLQEASGADAVDMESHAAARAASEAGLPFYVIRAISDDAGQSLPAAARGAVTPDGDVDTWRTVLRLLRRPQDLPAMLRLGQQASLGHETLRSAGRDIVLSLTGETGPQ